MIYNQQPERRAQGQLSYDYQTPAAFVEVIPDNSGMIGVMTAGYDLTWRIRIEHEQLNNDGVTDPDRNLAVFTVRDKVLRKLNGFKPSGCGPLAFSAETPDYNHTNTYLYTIDFRCHYIEQTSSIEDTELYQEGNYTSYIINRDEVQIYPHPADEDGDGIPDPPVEEPPL